jgi:mono/diheme cytochrome c family protein
MKTIRLISRLIWLIGLLAVIGIVGSLVYFFSGRYDVAANQMDPAIINWALEHVRDASVARHATDTPPASLDDQAMVQAGARAYSQRGCVSCHGGPGADWAKFSEGLNPDPPNLKDVVGDLSVAEIFWVVRNGIKMTGMPSFAASDPPVPDQEIWTIAAFVKKLPSVSNDDYKTWTAAAPSTPKPSPQ